MDMDPAILFSSLLIGLLGFSILMYGKKAQRGVPVMVGLAMCIYPYFVTNILLTWVIAAALMIPLWRWRDA